MVDEGLEPEKDSLSAVWTLHSRIFSKANVSVHVFRPTVGTSGGNFKRKLSWKHAKCVSLRSVQAHSPVSHRVSGTQTVIIDQHIRAVEKNPTKAAHYGKR